MNTWVMGKRKNIKKRLFITPKGLKIFLTAFNVDKQVQRQKVQKRNKDKM